MNELDAFNAWETEIFADKDTFITKTSIETAVNRWSSLYKDLSSGVKPKSVSAGKKIAEFIEHYRNLATAINEHNKAYTAAQAAKCNDMMSNIDGKSLDAQQRDVVLCNEDRILTLAGAGAGKTLTIAGKVKYLCEEQGVDPKDILLVAFTKKSAEEMTERISGKLGIPVTATT